MEAKIISYRRGRNTEYTNQFILTIAGVDSAEKAAPYAGKRIAWKTSGGKTISGVITKAHGNKVAMLARFDKGLPGQVLGSTVDVED